MAIIHLGAGGGRAALLLVPDQMDETLDDFAQQERLDLYVSQLLESASDMQPGGRSLCGSGVWLVLGVFRICDVRFMMRGFCGIGLSRYSCLVKATLLYPRHYTTEPLNHVNVTALQSS